MREQWALRGAIARLKEIDEEIKTIYEAFPELKNGKNIDRALPRPKRTMSAEARARMSEGMRKYWQRRKGSKSKKAARA
jgi:hypothetical protein